MTNPVVIGNAELWLGDCREILPTLRPVTCVVTSPPYNTLSSIPENPTGMWARSDGGGSFVRNVFENGYSDNLPEEEYQNIQRNVFEIINVIPDASLFYNHQIRWRDGNVLHPIDWFKPKGWKLRQEIIWDRGGGMMHNARMFCRFDERILWMVKGEYIWNQESVGYGTVWQIGRAQRKDHPVGFPTEIPTRCIAATTSPGDTVLDPYMGSATTGIAALGLGRKFIGIEIEPKYFEIACERIDQAQRQFRMFA